MEDAMILKFLELGYQQDMMYQIMWLSIVVGMFIGILLTALIFF